MNQEHLWFDFDFISHAQSQFELGGSRGHHEGNELLVQETENEHDVLTEKRLPLLLFSKTLTFQESNGAFQKWRTETQYIQKHYSVSLGQFLSISFNVLGRSLKYRSLKEKKEYLLDVYSDE